VAYDLNKTHMIKGDISMSDKDKKLLDAATQRQNEASQMAFAQTLQHCMREAVQSEFRHQNYYQQPNWKLGEETGYNMTTKKVVENFNHDSAHGPYLKLMGSRLESHLPKSLGLMGMCLTQD